MPASGRPPVTRIKLLACLELLPGQRLKGSHMNFDKMLSSMMRLSVKTAGQVRRRALQRSVIEIVAINDINYLCLTPLGKMELANNRHLLGRGSEPPPSSKPPVEVPDIVMADCSGVSFRDATDHPFIAFISELPDEDDNTGGVPIRRGSRRAPVAEGSVKRVKSQRRQPFRRGAAWSRPPEKLFGGAIAAGDLELKGFASGQGQTTRSE